MDATAPTGKATLRDVSRLAGVSRMTVSRVFLRPDQVSPDTREKVEAAVAALHYVPDRAAGSLATRRSGFVGLLMPTLTNGNFAALAEGLTAALHETGHELLVGYTGYDPAEETRQLRALLARRPEAVVLTAPGSSDDAARQMLAAAQIPVVEVAELADAPQRHAIGFSNHAVGVAAARYLAGLGHRRIAALGPDRHGSRADPRGEARMRGFAAGLRSEGLSTALLRADGTVPLSFAEGARAMARLLDETVPDAVFAVSDLVAVGAAMECRRRGLDVPDRISLLGFGDFEIGRELVPALSTVAVDFRNLGDRAGRLVGRLLCAGPVAEAAAAVDDVGFTLIERDSTRPARGERKRRP